MLATWQIISFCRIKALNEILFLLQALSDFCIDPYRAIQNYTVDGNYMSLDQTNYFLYCHSVDGQLFEEQIAEMKDTVEKYVPHLSEFSGNDTTTELQVGKLAYAISTGWNESATRPPPVYTYTAW